MRLNFDMVKIINVITSTCILMIISTGLSNSANAAPKKQIEKVFCKNTKAKGHTAKNIVPPEVINSQKNRFFTFKTNCGDVVIEADIKNAPVTVTALAALAEGGFFDQSVCHRLTTENTYLLHCGDPTATGAGGPSFTFNDENLPTANPSIYSAGMVAMFNTEKNPNGSQFFIVYQDTSLPSSYTIWGKVTKGLEIVQSVAKRGVVDGVKDGAPKQKISIERVKVR